MNYWWVLIVCFSQVLTCLRIEMLKIRFDLCPPLFVPVLVLGQERLRLYPFLYQLEGDVEYGSTSGEPGSLQLNGSRRVPWDVPILKRYHFVFDHDKYQLKRPHQMRPYLKLIVLQSIMGILH